MRVFQRIERPLLRALSAAGLVWFASPGATPALADDQPIVGVIDQARLVKIPAGTDTLIIGNSSIADVTLLKQKGLMVLTPKSFGETNFIALDAEGSPLAESTIQIVGDTHGLVVQRGMSRETYTCNIRCQPTEHLGDDSKYIANVSSDALAHTQRAAGNATVSQTISMH